jgi:hypothetical protein
MLWKRVCGVEVKCNGLQPEQEEEEEEEKEGAGIHPSLDFRKQNYKKTRSSRKN